MACLPYMVMYVISGYHRLVGGGGGGGEPDRRRAYVYCPAGGYKERSSILADQ